MIQRIDRPIFGALPTTGASTPAVEPILVAPSAARASVASIGREAQAVLDRLVATLPTPNDNAEVMRKMRAEGMFDALAQLNGLAMTGVAKDPSLDGFGPLAATLLEKPVAIFLDLAKRFETDGSAPLRDEMVLKLRELIGNASHLERQMKPLVFVSGQSEFES